VSEEAMEIWWGTYRTAIWHWATELRKREKNEARDKRKIGGLQGRRPGCAIIRVHCSRFALVASKFPPRNSIFYNSNL